MEILEAIDLVDGVITKEKKTMSREESGGEVLVGEVLGGDDISNGDSEQEASEEGKLEECRKVIGGVKRRKKSRLSWRRK